MDKIIDLASMVPGSLENKLKLRGDALWDIGENLHEMFLHPGKFLECNNVNCSGVRRILDLTEYGSEVNNLKRFVR